MGQPKGSPLNGSTCACSDGGVFSAQLHLLVIWWPLRKEGLRRRNVGVVTLNNTEKVKHLLMVGQSTLQAPSVWIFKMCVWKWEDKDFSLILVDTHFQFSCWKERSYYLLFHT